MAALIRRVLLVINPASRRGLKRRPVALRAFQRMGITVDELVTEHPGHAGDLLREGPPQVDAVFVLGGDGTVMEVATALNSTGVPIGVLPGGTGNLVAGVLGVPGSVRRAVPMLLGGEVKRLDLGHLPDGRCFAFSAGIGIDVDMILETTPGQKRVLGQLAYAISAARSALRARSFDVTAEVDGELVTGRAVLAMVANSGSLFGGQMLVGPGIEPDDGLLVLCLFTPSNVREVFSVAWRVIRRDFSPHPNMRYVSGRRIKLSSDPRAALQADGDVIGRTPTDIRVLPGAAAFLVPVAKAKFKAKAKAKN